MIPCLHTSRFALPLLAVAALLSSTAATGHAQSGARVDVVAVDLRSDAGQVLACLFAGEDGFPGKPEQALARARASIQNGKAKLSFPGVAPGTYAISVIHDENGNGKLDTNFVGIPKEGVGASNNPQARFGPPDYDDAKFQVGADAVTKRVALKYL